MGDGSISKRAKIFQDESAMPMYQKGMDHKKFWEIINSSNLNNYSKSVMSGGGLISSAVIPFAANYVGAVLMHKLVQLGVCLYYLKDQKDKKAYLMNNLKYAFSREALLDDPLKQAAFQFALTKMQKNTAAYAAQAVKSVAAPTTAQELRNVGRVVAQPVGKIGQMIGNAPEHMMNLFSHHKTPGQV